MNSVISLKDYFSVFRANEGNIRGYKGEKAGYEEWYSLPNEGWNT